MKPGLPVRADAAVPESLKPLRAAIYVRVSTADQNCELQIRDLHDYATRREWVVVDVYQDVVSGAKAHRPALTALMNDARARKFDCLLVWKLDRFGRSLVDCLNRIRDLETDGVRFIAITQGLDTDERNPVSRLLLHVLGAAAEFERSLILERSRAGQRRYRDAFQRGEVGRTVHSRSGRDLPPHRPRRIFDREAVICRTSYTMGARPKHNSADLLRRAGRAQDWQSRPARRPARSHQLEDPGECGVARLRGAE